MGALLCVDVGSTYTKAVLVDPADGAVLGAASTPTVLPPAGDVLDGLEQLRGRLAAAAGLAVAEVSAEELLVCSSAGGGLRLAVVGYEPDISALAGHRVALTAGGAVVHVHSGELDWAGLTALREARADVVLLVGGTDGGNAKVLLHNARRLAGEKRAVPVVLAGNADAAPDAAALLRGRGRTVEVVDNVLPRVGTVAPAPARAAIRDLFLRHVIGGRSLSRRRLDGMSFPRLVRAATPDAMLTGVGVLAEALGDVLVVDVGGATTDVYSALGSAALADLPRSPVQTLPLSRTVEADLGMRWGATFLIDAALAEGLVDGPFDAVSSTRPELTDYAALVAAEPARLPQDDVEERLEADLATLAVRVAVRRHGRPTRPGEAARPMEHLAWVVGSGGVLRHASEAARRAVLEPLTGDHGGGWAVPTSARLAVDETYLLFAVGLLASQHPEPAAALADRVRAGELR